jgi:protein phosphatase
MVADGMGGHLGGEVASHWAIETIKIALSEIFVPARPRRTVCLRETYLFASQAGTDGRTRASDMAMVHLLREAIRRANHVVRQYTVEDGVPEGMGAGSTLTMALVKGRRAYVANVGDSRTYLLREGQLAQVTKDHSADAELVAAGQITLAESFSHPKASLITRCLGCRDQIEADIGPLAVRAGDVLLLCSDGLWTMVRDPRAIVQVLTDASDLQSAAQALVAAANEAGGKDNTSVALMRLTSGPDIPG